MTQRLLRVMGLFALGALLLAGGQLPALAGPQTQAGPYRVELTTDPPVIPVGKARMILKITDAAGKPVEGAQVRAIAQMPGMPMGEQEAAALPQPGQPGVYAMPATFAMEGGYTATIKITGPQGATTAQIPLRTGQNTAAPAGGGFSPMFLLTVLAGFGFLAFVLYRVRRTGQRVNWRGVFNRQVLGGLALVAVMLAGAIFAVQKFRRPGAMTPIEAQGMEMSTPAPPGTAPVELATVQRGPVESTVRYTGQAVGFIEQDVTPRTRGYITWMPFYAGDRVRQGQVLARLDVSEIAPQVAERRAAVAIAEQGVSVTQTEYQQALAGVNQARAEVGTREGAVAEARSGGSRARGVLREAQTELRTAQGALAEAQGDVAAAEEERSASAAELAGTETQVADAAAQLQAAQADRQYWTVQLGRTRVLLTEGAVSDEEYRRERAQAENADAKVRQAQARVEQVQSQVRGARSRVRKADAMLASASARTRQAHTRIEGARARIEQAQADITAADARVQQAAAGLEAQRANVRQAQAAANAARQRIPQAQAVVRQARASLGGATTAEQFTEIRSQVEGVVTQRVISPGVLVNPGQTVLRVAQIRPIRLQANVAEADLGRIQVGAPVRIRSQNGTGHAITARVSSIAPAVDPVARTGLVEAIVPNRDRRFLPGQYVVMEISTGQRRSTLYVPSRALRWRAAPSGGVLTAQTTPYVWAADPMPGQENQFTVRQVEVQVGLSNGASTEVLSGLGAGQRVVVSGQEALKNGDTVLPVNVGNPTAPGETAPGAPAAPGGGMPGMPGMRGMPGIPGMSGGAAQGGTGGGSRRSGGGSTAPAPPEGGTPGTSAESITPGLPSGSPPAGMGSRPGTPRMASPGMEPSSGGAMSPGGTRPMPRMDRTPGMSPRSPAPGMGGGGSSVPAMPRGGSRPGTGMDRQPSMDMPAGGAVPDMPPRGGVPRTPPPSAQPAPRNSGGTPGIGRSNGMSKGPSNGTNGGRPMAPASGGGAPGAMSGMGSGR